MKNTIECLSWTRRSCGAYRIYPRVAQARIEPLQLVKNIRRRARTSTFMPLCKLTRGLLTRRLLLRTNYSRYR